MRKIIINEFKERRKKSDEITCHRSLLNIDGHSNRINSRLMEIFRENLIDVISIPSHCSHVLQPLDSRIYGPFKKIISVKKMDFINMDVPNRRLHMFKLVKMHFLCLCTKKK